MFRTSAADAIGIGTSKLETLNSKLYGYDRVSSHASLLAPPPVLAIEVVVMNTAKILAQLPQLTAAEREIVRSQLDAIDATAPLTSEEKLLVAERVASYRRNPKAVESWMVTEADIRQQLGL